MSNPSRAGGVASAYRPDIDGLRALAVVSVISFHAGFPVTPGGFAGVDIFFVISGYLITSLLFSELDANGRINFTRFWARRTRRLLPSALLVIIISLIAGRMILSDMASVFAARDAIFAATYTTNWQKLAAAVDYFEDGSGSGLFLHYWSLAVEEQFYLFLTLVFSGAMIATWLLGWSQRTCAGVVAGLLLVTGLASLGLNLVAVTDAQPTAFFGTHARIWQLAIGAAVGLIQRTRLSPPGWLLQVSSWCGLAMMLAAMGLFTDQLAYPGYFAVLPTLGAALFIFSGSPQAAAAPWPTVCASHWLPVSIGKLSYALYLWHWPVFMLYKAQFEHWDGLDKVIAIAVTASLALASHVTVENPIRFSVRLSTRPIASLAAALMLTVGLCGAAAVVQSAAPGNTILLASGKTMTAEKVRHDLPKTYADHCHADQKDADLGRCVYGQPNSPRKIFLLGDSHAAHWFPALEAIAAKRGFALVNRTKSACAAIDVAVKNIRWKREYTECASWRARVLEDIEREQPEMVVLANSSAHRPYLVDQDRVAEGTEAAKLLAAGEARTIARVLAAGSRVILMADLVWLAEDPIDCLVSHPGNPKACRWQADRSLPDLRSPWSTQAGKPPSGVQVIDLLDVICPQGQCLAATRDVVVLRDRHHLTASYAAGLADSLDAALFRKPEPTVLLVDASRQLRGFNEGRE
jgi:peptidoglycan/LPS O-acetylase OafA/YrhL